MNSFEWDAGFVFLLFCIAFPFVLTALFYYKSQIARNLTKQNKRLLFSLFALRVLSLFTILYLIGNPVVKRILERVELPVIAVLIDNSSSISYVGTDTAALKQKMDGLIEGVEGQYNIDFHGFDKGLISNDSLRFNGTRTNLAASLGELELKYRDKNLQEVILFTDGIVNEGYKELNNKFLDLSISTVCIGDSVSQKDIVLEGLYHNELAFLGNYLQVKSSWFCQSLLGQKLKLVLLLNDSLVAEKEVEIKKDQFFIEWNQEILMSRKGMQGITVKAFPLAGEMTIVNNEKSSYVEVKEKRQKIVVLYQSPHPDIKAFVSCYSEDKEYEVEVLSFSQLKPDQLNADLLVIYDRPSSKVEEQILAELLKDDEQNKLFFYPQMEGLSRGEDPFDRLLTSTKSNEVGGFYNRSFSGFQVDENVYDWLKSVPPLISPFGDYALASTHQVFINQLINGIETSLPLVSFRNLESSREGYLFGEGWWKWRFSLLKNGEDEGLGLFNQFVTQIVRYLLAGNNQSPLELKVPDVVNSDEDLLVKAILYDGSRQKTVNSDVGLILEKAGEPNREFRFLRSLDQYELRIPSLLPGEYIVEASVLVNGKTIKKRKKIAVIKDDIESRQLVPNVEFLRGLAVSHSGQFAYFENTDELLKEISNKNPLSKSYFDYISESLIHWKWLFFLLITLLSTEWFLRKFNGYV